MRFEPEQPGLHGLEGEALAVGPGREHPAGLRDRFQRRLDVAPERRETGLAGEPAGFLVAEHPVAVTEGRPLADLLDQARPRLLARIGTAAEMADDDRVGPQCQAFGEIVGTGPAKHQPRRLRVRGFAHPPISPSCGLDGSAKSRSGMRPAWRARRPASTASRIARAMATGSSALATAVLRSTPAQPSSMACAASEAVPIPASRITGTAAWRQMRSTARGFSMP